MEYISASKLGSSRPADNMAGLLAQKGPSAIGGVSRRPYIEIVEVAANVR
jgi:hypothetical protein